MKSLNTLKREAQRSTAFRGHTMRWGEPFGRADGPKSMIGRCQHCKAEVLLAQKPAPNGIEIGGNAVATNCEVHKFIVSFTGRLSGAIGYTQPFLNLPIYARDEETVRRVIYDKYEHVSSLTITLSDEA